MYFKHPATVAPDRVASGGMLDIKFRSKIPCPYQEAHYTTMTTIYLNEDELGNLGALSGSTVINQLYPYPYAGIDISTDIFEGHLSCLILLEIQQRADEALPIPAFVVREVTNVPFFTGGEFAKISKDELQRMLPL